MNWINKSLFCLLCITVSLQSQTKLPAFFADNMVIQQKESVAIWGNDIPNTTITISTTWGNTSKTVTDKDGNWKTIIKTKKASFTPETISIKGTSAIILKNVLIGEVWFCSGQSNMEMALEGLRKSKVLNAQKYIDIANNKNIRLFNVPRTASVLPSNDITAKWQESDVKSAKKLVLLGMYLQ